MTNWERKVLFAVATEFRFGFCIQFCIEMSAENMNDNGKLEIEIELKVELQLELLLKCAQIFAFQMKWINAVTVAAAATSEATTGRGCWGNCWRAAKILAFACCHFNEVVVVLTCCCCQWLLLLLSVGSCRQAEAKFNACCTAASMRVAQQLHSHMPQKWQQPSHAAVN